MKKAAAFVLSMIFLVCLLSSCNKDVDDMLDDYNGGFEKGYTVIQKDEEEEEEILQPGDPGFDERNMLRDEYFLGWDSTLNLYAPKTCSAFQWFLTNPDDPKDTKIEFYPYGSESIVDSVGSRIFSLYAETSGLEGGTTYKLTLNVWKGGKKYTDVCSLVVYQHYYWP